MLRVGATAAGEAHVKEIASARTFVVVHARALGDVLFRLRNVAHAIRAGRAKRQ